MTWIAPLVLAQAGSAISLISVDGRLAVREANRPPVSVFLSRLDAPVPPAVSPDPVPWTLKLGAHTLTFAADLGLTIVSGSRKLTTRVPDFLTSPKAFTRDEIRVNANAIARGTLRRDVASLSGFEVVGDSVFLLMQWRAAADRPFAEGLFQLDGMAERPKPALLTRVPALAVPSPGGDAVRRFADQLVWLTQTERSWGTARWRLDERAVGYDERGAAAFQVEWVGVEPRIRFVETTAYGTYLAGEFDDVAGRRNLTEGRRAARWVSNDPGVVWRSGADGGSLWFKNSGLVLSLPKAAGLGPSPQGLVVGWPAEKPTAGWLLWPDGRIRARYPTPAAVPGAKPPPKLAPSPAKRRSGARPAAG